MSGCDDSLAALWEVTVVFFLTQGPEGVQLANDRQGLCKDRWVPGAEPVYVEGGGISVALETRDDLSVFLAPGHLSPVPFPDSSSFVLTE